MTTACLPLVLSGPMQAWGDSSRFTRRMTSHEPTKSGVVGLLAAAEGRRRTDSVEDLVAMRLGVRVDQPGTMMRDFQTAQRHEVSRTGTKVVSLPLSVRYYLADAAFLALVEGPLQTLSVLRDALSNPAYPLYLGRRSCPPDRPVALEIVPLTLEEALQSFPWQASPRFRRRQSSVVNLAVVRDVGEGEASPVRALDVPVSFDPNHRQYAWRSVVRSQVTVANPEGASGYADPHDPMTAVMT